MEMTTDQQIFKTIVELEKSGTPACLVTVVKAIGSSPRKAGAKMLVLADKKIIGTVGGALLEALAIDTATDVMKDGIPRTESYDLNDVDRQQTKMICGGNVELFFEPIANAPWLYMFGAGHCGHAIAEAAYRAGFHFIIIDDRPELTNAERFPHANDIYCDHIPDVARKIEYRSPAYVVIATHCHEMDAETAIAVLEKGIPQYFGIIGSKRKRVEMKKWLEEVITPEDFDAHIHMPIGIDIGAETPEEIAVSVVAELIRVKRGTKGLYEAESGI